MGEEIDLHIHDEYTACASASSMPGTVSEFAVKTLLTTPDFRADVLCQGRAGTRVPKSTRPPRTS